MWEILMFLFVSFCTIRKANQRKEKFWEEDFLENDVQLDLIFLEIV